MYRATMPKILLLATSNFYGRVARNRPCVPRDPVLYRNVILFGLIGLEDAVQILKRLQKFVSIYNGLRA